MRRILTFVLCLTVSFALAAQQRVVYTINDAWEFAKDGCGATVVNIPHTWNAEDGDDDEPGYYRGGATYRKSLYIPAEMSGRYAEIYFEGAGQEAAVYVNGNLAGEHLGGYTAFRFDITPYIRCGARNSFEIRVSNRYNPDLPPLSGDFTFYGGIYRDVYLRFLAPVHIATDDYASSGVYIRTPQVSGQSATVEISTLLNNGLDSGTTVVVESGIRDADGRTVSVDKAAVKLAAAERHRTVLTRFTVENPQLWDTDSPYLYRVYSRIYDKKTGELLDEVSQPLGLRWFSFDYEKGFFLNGKHLKLVGTSRHQDFNGKGNALRDEFHVQDVMLLKEMGGNFLRVSHYPQDQVIMEMCDKLGIITSVEIPVVDKVTASQAFMDNCLGMAVEMVRQNFNHPSVVIWGYMNEIMNHSPFEFGEITEFTRKLAQALDDRIREEDPSRYTMMACHNSPSRYEKSGLVGIPMILAWNLYYGWYGGGLDGFQEFMDTAHEKYKDKVMIISEYGAGVDQRVHSYSPERFDFSQEYGVVLHRHFINEIMKRPYVAGSNAWKLADFYAEHRVDATPHVNNKGLLGTDREKKDDYLFYSAKLLSRPFLAIGNREWKFRGGAETSDGVCVQTVPVFANTSDVTLKVNGKAIAAKSVEDCTAYFDVPFVDRENILEASGEKDGTMVSDRLVVDFDLVPQELDSFTQINVMLGSPRYFDDREGGLAWIPEQEYRPGSWGYTGGAPYRRSGNLLGSTADIYGTDQEPVFQTQRVGIESFRADVPDGEYSVYLYWAELDNDVEHQHSVYNLGADETGTSGGERVFNVSINGTPVLSRFDIAGENGPATAVIKKFTVNVSNGEGLTVSFGKVKGEPVLNAIRIYKNY